MTSIKDIKTREIPDYYHIAIASLGLINFNLLSSFLGVLCAMPFLIVAIFNNGEGIGGADIKFMAAIGFALGLPIGNLASIFGLTFFIAFFLIKHDKEKIQYPMIPFLSLGCILSIFI